MIVVIPAGGEMVTVKGRPAIEPARGKASYAERVRPARAAGPPDAVHRDVISASYKHAAEMPDLYRACLSDARTRQAHLSTLSRYAEQNFRDRLTALGRQPRYPCR